jgi:hypothetical protein
MAAFTGAAGELVVDSTNNRLVLQDGATAGGFAHELARRTAVNDAAYTALATDRIIAYTAITAARAVTLPAASAYPTGSRLVVVDESGNCSATKTITLSRAGSDTINGAATAAISSAYGYLAIESNGSNAWTVLDQPGSSSSAGIQSANTVFAAPNGSSGMPSFRALVGADLPAPGASSLGGVESASAPSNEFMTGISTGGAPTFAQPSFANLSATISAAQLSQRTAVSDASYTALTTDRVIAYTAITAARTVALPAASAYPQGVRLTVVDESGSCSATDTITLSRAGSDTINGATSAVISQAYGYLAIESNGSNAWTILDSATLSMAQQAASAVAITGGTLSGVTETLAAGTSSTPPLALTAGTNTTTAEAGAIEYDGNVFYGSVAASERGVLVAEQIEVLSSTYTLTSQTAAQPLLNATANGAVTLQPGTYEFECFFALSSMSSTSGSYGFALGGTAIFTQAWQSFASKPTSLTGTANPALQFNTAAQTALTGNGAGTNGIAFIKGIVRVTAAGTVIPQVSLGVSAAAVVQAGSYFKIAPIGASGVTNVGAWS